MEKEEWKYDIVPEIMDGKNIVDFVDKDILTRLEELEKEEEMILMGKVSEEEEEVDEEMLKA